MQLFKIIRENSGLKPQEIAKKCGVSRATWHNYERSTSPRLVLKTLAKLRRVAGLSWEDFGKFFDAAFLD